MDKSAMKRIVILGAGFGGVYTLNRLEDILAKDTGVQITIVNNQNFFLFTPLLHEVATGNLSPDTVVEPIRPMLKKGTSDFFLADVSGISFKDKKVITTEGDNIPYDYLVVSLGTKTNFYNIPGAEENTFSLKSLKCAVKLKNHFIRSFEKATKMEDEDEIKKLLTFVIVGGGATGVELAAEMTDFLRGTFKKFYPPYITSLVSVTLIQSQSDLVPQFPASIRKISASTLRKKGVNVLLNRKVLEVKKDRIILDNDEELCTKTVVWTAGIQPADVSVDDTSVLDQSKRFIANEFLQLEKYPEVFVLGDGASFVDENSEKPLPALAQVATKQAVFVADNIKKEIQQKKLKPFKYKSSGTLISLGGWIAAGHIGKFTFWGKFAWWFWRTVYLSKMISKTKRSKVLLDWNIDLFFPRDISEL